MRSAPDAVLKSLADPTRRALFERLCREGEQTVWRLTAAAGVSQPAVSKHLRQLRAAGLVQLRRRGTRRMIARYPRRSGTRRELSHPSEKIRASRLDGSRTRMLLHP